MTTHENRASTDVGVTPRPNQRLDGTFWEQHWSRDADNAPASMTTNPPNPHLLDAVMELTPGTALDAGCGAGAEAIWLAGRGWQVTGVDISAEALARAAGRVSSHGTTAPVRWVRADLGTWEPAAEFDLVTTHYAHSTMPQLELYHRIARWVAPAGTLLIVGHLHDHADAHGRGAESSVTARDVARNLDETTWEIVTAEERRRTLTGPDGRAIGLQDVVVRATRRA